MSAALTLASGPLMHGQVPLGEAIAFWILGPISLAGAIGMVLLRNAIHSALSLVATMMCLGMFYLIEQGPFLGFVQIIVYTGAIMILFLFVLMLVGRDASDSIVETLRGQRWIAALFGIGFALLVAISVGRAFTGQHPVNLNAPNANGGNVHSIAELLFTKYLFAFELTSALLIIAAVGAMVLAHIEREGPSGPGVRSHCPAPACSRPATRSARRPSCRTAPSRTSRSWSGTRTSPRWAVRTRAR
jgi:NADH-quinone oxidoreductase subunit J